MPAKGVYIFKLNRPDSSTRNPPPPLNLPQLIRIDVVFERFPDKDAVLAHNSYELGYCGVKVFLDDARREHRFQRTEQGARQECAMRLLIDRIIVADKSPCGRFRAGKTWVMEAQHRD
ncbi:hypothetical protein VTN77DRAFT_9858 [Rasamsonia byssochlamydoides]|uniref:uncharacterized protein n=1 Tax=Rasamsonia byssochlamydoides TaxID=89139 RepID=UPI0037431A71